MKRILILLIFLSACQNLPTQVGNKTALPEASISEGDFKNFLKKSPVILDVRSALDFSVSHTPGAILVQWQDFSQPGDAAKGWLIDDEMAIARRLSLWGIDPETPVLVVGKGLNGTGEEGRVAWMLKYMGVKDVEFCAWTQIPATIPREEGRPENKPLWKPKVQEDWLITWEEFNKNVFQGHGLVPFSRARMQSLQVGPAVSGALGPEFLVLDVSAKERQGTELSGAKIPVKRIFWKEFFDQQGFTNEEARSILGENHINTNKIIYVINEDGVASGAVTMVLREWGFTAKNFAGGFQHINKVKKP